MREPGARDAGVPLVLAISLGAFTLWDYYFGPFGRGIRLLDLLGVGLIVVLLLTTLSVNGLVASRSIKLPAARWLLVLALLSMFIASGFVGSARDPANFLRPTGGVWMGMAVFLVYYSANLSRLWVDRVIGGLIIVHAFALLVQFVAHHSVGVLINYQAIIGAEPRVFSAIFRPSGLFLEPGSYAVTMIMLLLLRWIVSPGLHSMAWLALGSVVLTVSLFGVVAVCSILVFFLWKRAWFWLVACVTVLVAMSWLSRFSGLPEVAFLTDRLLGIAGDASVATRYGGMVNAFQETGELPGLWFGRGLGNDYVQFGASGFGFLVASVGLVGGLLWLAMAMGLSPRGRRIRVMFSLLLVLVAAPIWTMMFWWAWLGLLSNQSVVGYSGDTTASP